MFSIYIYKQFNSVCQVSGLNVINTDSSQNTSKPLYDGFTNVMLQVLIALSYSVRFKRENSVIDAGQP